MNAWQISFLVLYFVVLLCVSFLSSKLNNETHEGDNSKNTRTGSILGMLTFSATLFSTFTLMGMPDFVRVHGVGSWIFLGITDIAMAMVVLLFGVHFKRTLSLRSCTSVVGLLENFYGGKWASTLYISGVFVFLIPYVAIQIRGISLFLSSELSLDKAYFWLVALVILGVIFFYTFLGGLRAIMYSDAVQGGILLIATWTVAYFCVSMLGGIDGLFQSVRETNPSLLSTPGPKGLFSFQFLLASFLAIVVMPITQPQLTLRLSTMKNSHELRRMSIGIAVFAFIVILPTIAIGLYGGVRYINSSTMEFLSGALIKDHSQWLGALVLVGLLAAAMSTGDSQIFSLGEEFETFLRRDKVASNKNKFNIRLILASFSLLSFIFAIFANDQIVLLARISFTGTALMAPMILLATFQTFRLKKWVLWTTFTAFFIFSLVLLGWIPDQIGGWRMDLLLELLVSGSSLLFYLTSGKSNGN